MFVLSKNNRDSGCRKLFCCFSNSNILFVLTTDSVAMPEKRHKNLRTKPSHLPTSKMAINAIKAFKQREALPLQEMHR